MTRQENPMQVIKVADDGTKEFVRYVDTLYGERPNPTFPGDS